MNRSIVAEEDKLLIVLEMLSYDAKFNILKKGLKGFSIDHLCCYIYILTKLLPVTAAMILSDCLRVWL